MGQYHIINDSENEQGGAVGGAQPDPQRVAFNRREPGAGPPREGQTPGQPRPRSPVSFCSFLTSTTTVGIPPADTLPASGWTAVPRGQLESHCNHREATGHGSTQPPDTHNRLHYDSIVAEATGSVVKARLTCATLGRRPEARCLAGTGSPERAQITVAWGEITKE